MEIEMSEQSPNSPEVQQQSSKDRAWREWMMVAVGITGLLAVLGVIVSLAALSSKSSTSTTTVTVQAARSATPAATVPSPLSMTVGIKADDEHGRMGPDKQWHDAFLPADYTVHAGQTVTMTFQNYDGGPHTFTAPSLNVNQMIPGGGSASHPVTATVTFTAPKTPGKYQWWCAVPCDPWAMSHDGYMRGYVTVVS
jgi:plastocyanin